MMLVTGGAGFIGSNFPHWETGLRDVLAQAQR
jgi:dTDP-D-glucose 4,6-dehydratase